MTVCANESPSAGRRYEWIEYKSGRLLGTKSECKRSGQSSSRVDSWWRWWWHCSYCVCQCDQPGPRSDRYVSLRGSVAADGQLVTGVRFVKVNRVVHVQIQQGAPLGRGTVNASTLAWKAVDEVIVPRASMDLAQDGPGYATLRYEERSLDLDDLTAPDGHVVTGVRLRKIGGHLNLEVQTSPIDFATGTIDAARSVWLANDKTPAAEDQPRSKLLLVSPDVPTRSSVQSVPDSQAEQYVDFQASSIDKDVGQTTVPFLDAQPVVPQSPSWLTGVGIYHKGQLGYGGYVALRLSTLNVTNYLMVPNIRDDFNGGREIHVN